MFQPFQFPTYGRQEERNEGNRMATGRSNRYLREYTLDDGKKNY